MRGHLVIADISGYTQFLTEGELDHAQGIVTELLNSIISATQAPLTVSNIEGDAVFMYGETPDDVYGQTVLELVESLYVSFAGALETMVLNTTCDCNACANINGLGLKIVMHCGEFVKTQVGGTETLTGPDVIGVHRLLKNQVKETTGIADYFLLTEACVEELSLQRVVASWIPHVEDYEHVGEIKGFVSSLADVWEFLKQQRSMKVVESEAWATFSGHTVAPPPIVWDHLIDPRKRNHWLDADSSDLVGDINGRVGPGSEFHCAHGDQVAVFTVLDSRPNEYMTLMTPFSEGSSVRYTHYLLPSGTGTKVVTYVARPEAADPDSSADLPLEQGREIVLQSIGGALEQLYEMADATMVTPA